MLNAVRAPLNLIYSNCLHSEKHNVPVVPERSGKSADIIFEPRNALLNVRAAAYLRFGRSNDVISEPQNAYGVKLVTSVFLNDVIVGHVHFNVVPSNVTTALF